jgi:cobalamin biosynthesis Mg chelatase CobN
MDVFDRPSIFRGLSASFRRLSITGSNPKHPSVDVPEDKRHKDFLQSSAEQQVEFAEEEVRQCEGEHSRNEEFDEFVSQILVATTAKEQLQDNASRLVRETQEAIFTEHESARKKTFDEGQALRLSTFEESQQQRQKDAQSYEQVRDTRLKEGRKERLEVFQGLKKDFLIQVGELLVVQEQAFLQNERRRDEIVRKYRNKSSGFKNIFTRDTLVQSVTIPGSWNPILADTHLTNFL